MSEATQTAQKRNFVLFPLGEKRFALLADVVTELARPDRLHTFPHTTTLLSGVLWRRGQIVPVCDVAPLLIGPEAPERKFYLIAARRGKSFNEWTALPVTGECELATSELLPVADKLPGYVCGLISLGNEIVEVIDLERIMTAEGNA